MIINQNTMFTGDFLTIAHKLDIKTSILERKKMNFEDFEALLLWIQNIPLLLKTLIFRLLLQCWPIQILHHNVVKYLLFMRKGVF